MTDDQPDWRLLSHILQGLTSFSHPFRRAFFYSQIESAIANAVRSGEVPVRGRRFLFDAFERVEKHLGPNASVDLYLDKITIPNTRAAFSVWPQMNAGILPDQIIVRDGGAGGTFMNVEADQHVLERWIRENALPRWGQEALAEGETAIKATGVNEQKRAAVLEAIASLGCDNLRKMPQKEREAKIIGVVKQGPDGLRVTDRYVRKLYSEKLRNVPK